MKKVLISIAVLLSLNCTAQNVKVTKSGNYVAISHADVKDTTLKATGHTYTDSKGKVYPVYTSSRGNLFVIRTSKKTHNKYKYYLKVKAKPIKK